MQAVLFPRATFVRFASNPLKHRHPPAAPKADVLFAARVPRGPVTAMLERGRGPPTPAAPDGTCPVPAPQRSAAPASARPPRSPRNQLRLSFRLTNREGDPASTTSASTARAEQERSQAKRKSELSLSDGAASQ